MRLDDFRVGLGNRLGIGDIGKVRSDLRNPMIRISDKDFVGQSWVIIPSGFRVLVLVSLQKRRSLLFRFLLWSWSVSYSARR